MSETESDSAPSDVGNTPEPAQPFQFSLKHAIFVMLGTSVLLGLIIADSHATVVLGVLVATNVICWWGWKIWMTDPHHPVIRFLGNLIFFAVCFPLLLFLIGAIVAFWNRGR
ncbi:MAG TPA: hypothetical protein VEJ63_22355 [Planctomycetota bacterium]|nr:hypothetical protein [Planctomycetota bacterium]